MGIWLPNVWRNMGSSCIDNSIMVLLYCEFYILEIGGLHIFMLNYERILRWNAGRICTEEV